MTPPQRFCSGFHSQPVFYVIAALLLTSPCLTQKTYQRTCQCEQTVNGQCAYTLLLPVSSSDPGSCPTSPPIDSNVLAGLQANITALQASCNDQTKYIVVLQSSVLSQSSRLEQLEKTVVIAPAQSSSQATSPSGTAASSTASTASCADCTGLATSLATDEKRITALENSRDSTTASITYLTTQVTNLGAMLSSTPASTGSQAAPGSSSAAGSSQSPVTGTSTGTVEQRLTALESIVAQLAASPYACTSQGLLVSGVGNSLPDGSITASSVLSAGYGPERSRINTVANGTLFGSWCPADQVTTNINTPWLQYDLGAVKIIYSVITRGRQDYNQWVTAYNVQIGSQSASGQMTWTNLSDPTGDDIIFQGNSDSNTLHTNMLWQPIRARYVRIVALQGNPKISANDSSSTCMRADLIGCLN